MAQQKFSAIRLVIAGAGVVAAVAFGLGAWQVAAPVTAPLVFPLSETYSARTLETASADEKVVWAKKAIKVAPARAENWLLLAYAYHTADKKLTPRVIDAIRQSYAVAPLSPDAHDWRLSYIYQNWALLPKDVHQEANAEVLQYLRRDTGRKYIRSLIPQVRDPGARLSLAVNLLQKQAEIRVSHLQSVDVNEGR